MSELQPVRSPTICKALVKQVRLGRTAFKREYEGMGQEEARGIDVLTLLGLVCRAGVKADQRRQIATFMRRQERRIEGFAIQP